MEEVSLFLIAIFFGAFLFILVMLCCLRFVVYLRDEDTKHLCFKRKHAALRRRRIQLSLLPEVVFHRTENLGYTAAPDENINEYTICQPYVYEDGRSTGMRMIANLPIAIAFTSHSGIPTDSIFGILPSFPLSPRLVRNTETRDYTHELPPPDYIAAQIQQNNSNQSDKTYEYIEIEEPPPPTYDECMKNNSAVVLSSLPREDYNDQSQPDNFH